jgi:hypothetical protein
MRTTSIALLALVALAACSDAPADPIASPSSAFGADAPTAASGATATGPAASGPSGPPTTSPGPANGSLTSGRVTYRISGDLEDHGTLATLVTATYAPSPGGFAIVWQAGGTDPSVIGLGGGSFVGTRSTAPSLSLSLTVLTTGGLASFLSIDGECDVSIDVAAEDELSGGFTCSDLTAATGEIVDVTASFSATG